MREAKNKKSNRKLASKPKKVNLLWVIAGVFLLAVGAIFIFRPKPDPYVPEVVGSPRLQVEQEKIDLGNQQLGTTIDVKLIAKNVGNQPLKFSQAPYIEVKEGCCPSTPSIGKMTLAPGESTSITFPMMMHTGMGGYHDFRVHIPNNDPENGNFAFTVLSNWQ